VVDAAAAAVRPLTGLRRLLGRPLGEWLVVALLCAGLAAGASWNGWLWRVDSLLYDAAMATQRLPADPALVVVAIDDQSLAEIGRWPWPRAVHAALLERLAHAGADVVALDIILAEPDPDNPAGDAALARAMAAHGRVVLPVTHGTRGAASAGESLPDAPFAAAAAALGHIHIELDPDGIARSAYLWEGMGSARHPQLALAALTLHAPAKARRYARLPGEVEDAGWRREGWFHIPFIGPPGSFRYLSYVDVLRGELPRWALQGAVVFVGATAVGMGDIVPTPTSGHARPMPGVEVHANIFNALHHGLEVRPLGRAFSALLAMTVVTALLLLMLRAGPRYTLVAGFAFTFAILAGCWALLTLWQLWLPPAGALAGCLLAYPLWSWRRLEAAQRYLDAELAALRTPGGPFGLGGAVAAGDALDPFRARIALVRDAARRERALQRFVADTLDALPVGALVVDPCGQIRLANRRASHLLGSNRPELQRRLLAALPWPAGHAEPGGLPVPPPGGTPLVIEGELQEGQVVLVSVSGLADEHGTSLGAVFGLADIGPIRNAQRSREDMMYFLSHDLRSPLSSILTLLESPPDDAGGAPGRERRLGGYARKALGMADNLLRLVRAEVLDPQRFREVGLEMLVMDAADEVWALARARQVAITTRIAAEAETGPCEVMGERELLYRALVNLLSNAIKYSPAGGQVVLALAPLAGGWAISVQDYGRGIRPEELPRLFRRFSRVGGAGPAEGGVGLGLLMVRTVAERHGGSVEVSSREGEGSTFTLFLPAARKP
jgi:CHASE2 domain-containing sensor protein/signal transduction histidine kinase